LDSSCSFLPSFYFSFLKEKEVWSFHRLLRNGGGDGWIMDGDGTGLRWGPHGRDEEDGEEVSWIGSWIFCDGWGM